MLARLLRVLRDAWLVLGVVLVVLLALEIVYRVQASLRSHPEETVHPHTRPPWFDDYLAEARDVLGTGTLIHWQPYVYWRRGVFRGRYINVDSSGHRVTPQPAAQAPARRVAIFGGSTMWGSYQRDSATIAAAFARRLHDDGWRHVEVTNFGETGYVFTQEVIALELALRGGLRPDLVVFYDGINDVASAVMNARAGIPQNETNREEEFRRGRILSPWNEEFHEDARALGTLTGLLVGRSALVRRMIRRPGASMPAQPPGLGGDVASVYVETARWVEALALQYGFKVVYAWQPSPQTSSDRANGALDRAERAIQVAARPVLAAGMGALAGNRFADLAAMFGPGRDTVFVDQIGHTTEAAAAEVGDSLAALVVRAVPESLGARAVSAGAPPSYRDAPAAARPPRRSR